MRVLSPQRWLALFLITLCVFLDAQVAQAHQVWARRVGSFCIDGVSNADAKIIASSIQNGVKVDTWHVKINLPPSAKAKPIFRLFAKPPTAGALVDCKDIAEPVLIEGSITALKLTLKEANTPAGAEMQIKPHELDATLGRVGAMQVPLYGGSLGIAGPGLANKTSLAWVTNSEELLIKSGSAPQGAIEVRSWGRRLTGAQIFLGGAPSTTSSNLSAGNTDVTLRLPLDGSPASLLEGRMASGQIPLKSAAVMLPGSRFENLEGAAKLVEIVADGMGVVARMRDLSFTYTSAAVVAAPAPPTPAQFASGRGSATIAVVEGPIERQARGIDIKPTTIDGIQLAANDCTTKLHSLPLAASSRCVVTVSRAASGDLTTAIDHAQVTSGMTGEFMHGANTRALLSFKATDVSSSMEGVIERGALALGALDITSSSPLKLQRTTLSNFPISIPFDVEAPAAAGNFVTTVEEKKVGFRGTLTRFGLHGRLVIDSPPAPVWRVEVGKDDFQFAASGLVTVGPLLYGGVTNLVGADVRFKAIEDILVSAGAAKGKIVFRPLLTTVLDPTIDLGDEKGPLTLKGPATFSAASSLVLDLATGRTSLRDGTLALSMVQVETKSGRPGAIGQLRFASGKIGMDALTLMVADGVGTMTLDALKLNLQDVDSGASSAEQTRWRVAGPAALSIKRVVGTIAPEDPAKPDTLAVKDTTLFDLIATVDNASVGGGGALQVEAGKLEVRADVYSPVWLRNVRLKFSDGMVSTDAPTGAYSLRVKQFDLAVSGDPKAPEGSGRLALYALDAIFPAPIELKISCIGAPDFQKIPANAHVLAGPVDFPFEVHAGHPSGDGIAFPVSVEVKGTGRYDCRNTLADFELVPAQRWRTEYPCGGTIADPIRTCEAWGETPAVTVTIDSRVIVDNVYYSAVMAAARLKLRTVKDGERDKDRLEVCPGPMVSTGPLIDASVFVQPRTPSDVFDRMAGDIMNIVARPYTNATVNTFTVGFGLAVQYATWFAPFQICK